MPRTWTEIHSLDEFDHQLKTRGDLKQVVIQGLDLTKREGAIQGKVCSGTVFLGCTMTAETLIYVTEHGAMVFPRVPNLPYKPYRPGLYTMDELMKGYVRGDHSSFLAKTADSRIYEHYDQFRKRPGPLPILEALTQRLHDHAVDDALDDLLHSRTGAQKKVVGIMGGHAMKRDEPEFLRVASIGRALASAGLFVATGGGPGAMEAANLGARLVDRSPEELASGIRELSAAPSYKDEGWFDTAYDLLDSSPGTGESLAIPTWFYGHEPSNLFATHVAKYFSNSLREDGLLAIALHGVIYAPGSAGTIQEVFMDSAQNHYGTFGEVSPMVFLGVDYWTHTKPVFPMLKQLAQGQQYAEMLCLTDDVDEAVQFVLEHPPVKYQLPA